MKPPKGAKTIVKDEDLLNPHGSDETPPMGEVTIEEENFLTHTVQMKLYYCALQTISIIIFLTHTVQMKLTKASLTLPTIPKLLNPHGSDETQQPTEEPIYTGNFLTHTVQMKLLT